jgi:hypothetical protein
MKKSNSKYSRRRRPNKNHQQRDREKKDEKAPAERDDIVTAELVWTEQEFKQHRQIERQRSRRRLFRRTPGSRNLQDISLENDDPPYPRTRLANIIRCFKIMLAMLNIIVIRGSILTRRKLDRKFVDYQQLPMVDEEVILLYRENLSHHLWVFYLSWGRLLTCLTVLMWGTCDERRPQPWILYIGMLMHWVDSIRGLDSNHWLPSSEQENIPDNSQRESTAEEEVQTALAWLHLFWFIVDGFYCRQVLKDQKKLEQRKKMKKQSLKSD